METGVEFYQKVTCLINMELCITTCTYKNSGPYEHQVKS